MEQRFEQPSEFRTWSVEPAVLKWCFLLPMGSRGNLQLKATEVPVGTNYN